MKNVGKDLLAYNIINEQEVFCPYEDCSWTVLFVALREHSRFWSCMSTMSVSIKASNE
jgi:hypothetical protein